VNTKEKELKINDMGPWWSLNAKKSERKTKELNKNFRRRTFSYTGCRVKYINN
jgi:hypothetical protein